MDEHEFMDTSDMHLNPEQEPAKAFPKTQTVPIAKGTDRPHGSCHPVSNQSSSSQANSFEMRDKCGSSDSGLGESSFIDPSWFDEDSCDVFPDISS